MDKTQFDTSANREQIVGVYDVTFNGIETKTVFSSIENQDFKEYPLFDFYVQPPGTNVWIPMYTPFIGARYYDSSGSSAQWSCEYWDRAWDIFGGTTGQVTKAKIVEYRSKVMSTIYVPDVPQQAKTLFTSLEKAPKVAIDGELFFNGYGGTSLGLEKKTITHNLGRYVDFKAWYVELYNDSPNNDEIYRMMPMNLNPYIWPTQPVTMDLNSITFNLEKPYNKGKIIYRIYENA